MSDAALSAGQTRELEAMIARLIPADELGPGAVEGGVMRYLETALSEWHAHHVATYAEGLARLEQSARSAHGRGFADCDGDQRDALLEQAEGDEAGASFVALVRTHTIEGMFGDPAWGGNAGGAGWALIGYPGPREAWSEAEQQLGGNPPAGMAA